MKTRKLFLKNELRKEEKLNKFKFISRSNRYKLKRLKILLDLNEELLEKSKFRKIRDALSISENRKKLAESIANPIFKRLDMESIARKTFSVQQLPEGALPVYDRE